MTEIYRMKIRQVQLNRTHHFEYFPFDNVYIVPTEEVDNIAPRMFRYCLRMEATPAIIDVMRKIKWLQRRSIGLKRDDEAFKWKPVTSDDESREQTEFLTTGHWTCIIPTYAITAPKKEAENKQPQLQYLVTHALKTIHNRLAVLPPIILQTPKRTIPALCAVCKHMAGFYQNKCAPATYTCKTQIFLNTLEEDPTSVAAVTESIQNSGAVE